MEVEVTVEGESELMDAVDGLPDRMQKEIEDLMAQLAKEGLDYMNDLTPVLTGYLKSRNQVEADGLEFTLGNDADYAVFVEMGTRFMHAQPFFYPTVEYLNSEMETVLAQVLTA